ncbi:MAG: hypothetical protein BWX70_00873 [Verrucomicrobia bacterium ADurb.Bin070]|nr:MAG: hypothetical protein BWX70_00873 [Verrucomicrobia bacterium ADurb.Bin070]
MQNRREFIKGSSVFAAMMAAAPTISIAQNAPRVFKVGMIGAGGRCSGAMAQIIEAAKNLGHEVKLVAVCDFFEDRAKGPRRSSAATRKTPSGTRTATKRSWPLTAKSS